MSKAKIFLVCMVWLVILTACVSIYRLWLVPNREQAEAKQKATQQAQQEQQQQEVLGATSGSSTYKHRIKIGLDGFSGYAILRSAELQQQLRSRGIKATLVDDAADYGQRMSALADGTIQMAAFPIDALLKSSEAAGGLPATIVAILDETRGADAVVAYKDKYPDIDALNSPDTRFLFVGDSPSETLLHVVLENFDLDLLSPASLVPLGSESELLQRYKQATPGGSEVFITWEPLVSSMKKNPAIGVLTDTAKQPGYVVDTLVVNRDFLIKNEAVVTEVLESYFRALYTINDENRLAQVIGQDAASSGMKLDAEQVTALTQGIVWKNTQENFAHFGLRSASVSNIEDMVDRIKELLLNTGGLKRDPTDGQSSRLFYEQPLAQLLSGGFHPGVKTENVREQDQVQPLSDAKWQALVPVGTAQVPPLIYARGTARLTESSLRKLDALAEKLDSWPMYYLMVRGNASSRGNAEANRTLAKQRADAAVQYLLSKGVSQAKIRAVDGEITGQTSVTFLLGEPAY